MSSWPRYPHVCNARQCPDLHCDDGGKEVIGSACQTIFRPLAAVLPAPAAGHAAQHAAAWSSCMAIGRPVPPSIICTHINQSLLASLGPREKGPSFDDRTLHPDMQRTVASSSLICAGPAARLHAARRSADRVARPPCSARRCRLTVQASKDKQQEQLTGVTFNPFEEVSRSKGCAAWQCWKRAVCGRNQQRRRHGTRCLTSFRVWKAWPPGHVAGALPLAAAVSASEVPATGCVTCIACVAWMVRACCQFVGALLRLAASAWHFRPGSPLEPQPPCEAFILQSHG